MRGGEGKGGEGGERVRGGREGGGEGRGGSEERRRGGEGGREGERVYHELA